MTASQARLADGVALHQAGRLDEAAAIYAEVLAREPKNADAHQYLGLVALRRGALDEAIAHIERAVALDPNAAAYHYNLGLARQRRGEWDAATASYRKAVALAPGLAEAHNNLGNILRERGDAAGAVENCRRAIAARPVYAEAHLNLSLALADLGRLDEAEKMARRAVALGPQLAQAHQQFGDILQRREKFADAVAAYRRALEVNPDAAAVHLNLGNTLQALGRIDEAVAAFRRVLEIQPDNAEALNNLGNACLASDQRSLAIEWYRRALAAAPDFALAWSNLGVALQQEGRLDEARAAYERSIASAPGADTHNNLGLLLPIFGEVREALRSFRRAIELRPDFSTAYRNLMGVMLYDGNLGESDRAAVAAEFGQLYAAKLPPKATFTGSRDLGRRLRIGYVSSDFYDHPVGRNMEPLLAARDQAQTEVVAYVDGGRQDFRRERLRGLVDEWREIGRQSDAELAEQIRRDGIDILVLLAGRFDRNRPLVASYRAAPVQVSFHDPGTSGVPGMDYLVADPVLVPRRPEEKFAERVVRLGRFYAHEPLGDQPGVNALPSATSGRVTFGSFNNPAKIGSEVLRLWGEVLRAVPGAVLRVKFKNWFANAGLRARFLAGLGVPPERVEFVTDEKGLQGHLAEYHAVDIALDPYPFTGSTTTFEALWMGVPVVTLLGRNMAGRWSASMLRGVRLEEMIARDAGEYVAIARALANDRNRLAALRAGLRERLVASSLCNGRTRARQVERLYRALWRRYCAS